MIPVPGKDRIPPAVDGSGCLQGEVALETESQRNSQNTAQKARIQMEMTESHLLEEVSLLSSGPTIPESLVPSLGTAGRSIPLRPEQDMASSLGVLPRNGASGKA